MRRITKLVSKSYRILLAPFYSVLGEQDKVDEDSCRVWVVIWVLGTFALMLGSHFRWHIAAAGAEDKFWGFGLACFLIVRLAFAERQIEELKDTMSKLTNDNIHVK